MCPVSLLFMVTDTLNDRILRKYKKGLSDKTTHSDRNQQPLFTHLGRLIFSLVHSMTKNPDFQKISLMSLNVTTRH